MTRVKVRYRWGCWEVRHNGKVIARKYSLEAAHREAVRYSKSRAFVRETLHLVS